MRFPLASFVLATIIWIFLAAIFFYAAFKKSSIIPASLEVDASIIDEASRQVGKNSDEKNNAQEKQFLAELKENPAIKSNNAQKQNALNQGGSKTSKVATIVARPLPEIPDDLRQEAFSSHAVARFHIAIDGSASVELVQPCNNPRLNQLLLQSLRKWKFAPTHTLGVATASVQDVQINFKVE